MDGARLGGKVRAVRRRLGLTQARMAEELGISASYLNLIEHDKRPLTAPLLIQLAQTFDVDLAELSSSDDSRLQADLMEVFGDQLFEAHGPTNAEVRELVQRSPVLARCVLDLYRAYATARESVESLASRVDDLAGVGARLPSEEVTELVQRHSNWFPALEEAAHRLWADARLDPDDVWSGMVRYLEDEGVRVRVVEEGFANNAVRLYDPERRELFLSEVLAPRSRHFQLATQIGLLTQDHVLAPIATDPVLTTDASRTLARVVLAQYFAGAVLHALRSGSSRRRAPIRYDIELLGHRFRTSFEQVCHRLTTLHKPGASGVPFHLVKIDTAGNLSKRFSGSGIRFARFGGACPRWNVSNAFLSGDQVRIQISRMPDGETYFCVARTLRRRHGGFHAAETVHAIGLGCQLEHASELVYADGVDLNNVEDLIVPIGVTCRLCERRDCEQRAFPSLQQPLELDENSRGIGFYTTVVDR